MTQFGLKNVLRPAHGFGATATDAVVPDLADMEVPWDRQPQGAGALIARDVWAGLTSTSNHPGHPAVVRSPADGYGQVVLLGPDGATLSSGGSTTTTTTVPSTTSATSTSPFVINLTWDASVGSAPSGFTAGILAAAQYLESQFTDAVTVNINVGYGEVGGTTLASNALGQSSSYIQSLSYSSLSGALKADAKTATDSSVASSLPASNPSGGTYWTTTAQAKALGVAPATGTSTDGFVGFSSAPGIFTYDSSAGVSAGTYDFKGVVLHEISEVMGRLLLTGGTIGSTANSYSMMDLLHYSGQGTMDFSASTPGYLSFNGGATASGTFNTVSGGDAGDWASSMGNDAFNAFSNSGVVNGVSAADLAEMDAIGWDYAAAIQSNPTGVSVTPATGPLAAAQGASGIAANAALANIGQIGGSTADSYAFTLGGAGAGSFTLSGSGSKATLAAGASGVAGSTNGALYALTLTATDQTSGSVSPASPLDVVVGSGGSDTVSLATLSGSLATSTPTFVYGLAGSDRIDGTGMTGRLWFEGGAGADTMTGGSGVNDYLYGSASESALAAMDVITNFHASGDVIDLTGLGSTLKYAGQLNKTSIAGHSVGWQVTGGNTYVYANTGGSVESLTSTNMKIELLGSVSLSSSNIVHL